MSIENNEKFKDALVSAARELGKNEFRIRHELDVFRHATDIKARHGECEGGCEEHYGEVKSVRVFHKATGTDWGYFSYCESARKEDVENRGMELEVPNEHS